MGLDVTTYVLEMVNFLVLLWLLTHFLYRPVQSAIGKRQQQAEQAEKALQAQRLSLDAKQTELQQARAQLDAEREKARKQLDADVAAERARRFDALNAELGDERAKVQARAAAQQNQEARRQDELAAQRAQGFVRHYLERLAGAELEGAIVALFLSDLAALDEEARKQLQQSLARKSVEVVTAFAPADAARRQVEAALQSLLGQPAQARWQIDSALIAGISVRLDGHLLEASLARALDAFGAAAEAAA